MSTPFFAEPVRAACDEPVEHRKGLDILLLAVRAVIRQLPSARFLVVGSIDDSGYCSERELKNLAISLFRTCLNPAALNAKRLPSMRVSLAAADSV